jgi:hypothetical protein
MTQTTTSNDWPNWGNAPNNDPNLRGIIACFRPWDWAYDSYVRRWEVTSVLIPIRKSYIDSAGQAMQIHIFEHELGHGFGLAHHGPCQPFVMEDPPCSSYWVDTPDITMARCVYGYAC